MAPFMTLHLSSPDQTLNALVEFIRHTFDTQKKQLAVVAVSGGIDSALALTLVTRALGTARVRPLFLPYQNQSTADAELICTWNQIPTSQWQVTNIEPIVRAAAGAVGLDLEACDGQPIAMEQVRAGNLMARARMMVVFDVAKKWDALVCGTENKSEHYLGYFTRFGDAASDLEPISTLYKTQVRQLATHLGLPEQLITKPPSAGLWQHQTDEDELGFTYEQADQVLQQVIDEGTLSAPKVVPGIDPDIQAKVIGQVKSSAFKRVVPYVLE